MHRAYWCVSWSPPLNDPFTDSPPHYLHVQVCVLVHAFSCTSLPRPCLLPHPALGLAFDLACVLSHFNMLPTTPLHLVHITVHLSSSSLRLLRWKTQTNVTNLTACLTIEGRTASSVRGYSPTRLKGRQRSVFPLCPCPIPKQTVNMKKIMSLPPLWLLLHHCGVAQVAVERKIDNLSPGNLVNPDGRARAE